MTSRYPSRNEIEALCSHLGTNNAAPFFDKVSPNVEWDVMGMYMRPPYPLTRTTILPFMQVLFPV